MALIRQTLMKSLLEARSVFPPTFLLPMRAGITTISHNLETGNIPEQLIQSGQHLSKDLKDKIHNSQLPSKSAPAPASPTVYPAAHVRTDNVARELTEDIRTLLPLLHSQPAHYITIHIHGHPYLLTLGDTLRLPFLMPKVQAGDTLRLNRATHIGSRDYTLKAPEPAKGTRDQHKRVFYLDDRLFVCRATVVGVESEPLRIMEKTKRRQRHIKHVKSKHRYTILRISELQVKSLEEYEAEIQKE
ncbi:hypothetical protein CC78DRAFT_528402 [Lojkania enalia]|uniref:Large ribosomal subunit protein bL21m n=1 Tax=Lojkania enalia TaxID=147567 RepID=A0A9P4NCS9_9PLEO|nr:hypothetical protein CC78DRAFT_528402 [Didymosphaeria enalia]